MADSKFRKSCPHYRALTGLIGILCIYIITTQKRFRLFINLFTCFSSQKPLIRDIISAPIDRYQNYGSRRKSLYRTKIMDSVYRNLGRFQCLLHSVIRMCFEKFSVYFFVIYTNRKSLALRLRECMTTI